MTILRLLLIVLSAWMLSATRGLAQDRPAVGMLGGFNVAGLGLDGSGAAGLDPGVRAGGLVGGFGVVPLTSRLALEFDAAWSRKRMSLSDPARRFAAADVWDWIDVPVLLRYRLTEGMRGPYLTGGGGLSVLTRAREEEGTRRLNLKNAIRSVDAPVIGGVGYMMGRFGIEARIDVGLRDLNRGLASDMSVRSRVVRTHVTWAPLFRR
jgi:hypothetical protein